MPLRQLFPDPRSSSGDSAKVDIIAIHGLNPKSKNDTDHAWDTWRTPPGDKGRLWLREDLPEYVPESRIFLYAYNSTAVYGKDQDTFVGKANELLEALRIKRDGVESRPILFLGHSMGGLLIKQALVNAQNNPKYTLIKEATKGIAFFATPHDGGDRKLVNLGAVAAKIATSAGFQKGDDVLETLKKGSLFSDILQEHFRHQLENYNIVSFWGSEDNIVPPDSARLQLPGDRENVVKLNADHRTVCKFNESQKDRDNFELVGGNIRDMYKKALQSIESVTNVLNMLSVQGIDEMIPPVTTRKPVYHIPLLKNKRFVGRTGQLDALRRAFFKSDCQKVAVAGLGGMGKTQIALQFAYWVKGHKPQYSIFWVPALSQSSFEQAYTEIAKKLSIAKESQDEDIKDAVCRYLSSDEAGPWFLVVDNADDRELFFGDQDTPGLNDFIPQHEDGLVLFTTRSGEVAFSVVDDEVIELNEMDPQDAMILLNLSLGKASADKVAAEELLEELGYLPLAITQAAAYLKINRVSIARYLELLRGTEQDMVSLMTREFHDSTRYRASQNAVATTWLVSFDQISKYDSAAAELLAFVSCIEPKAIPESILPRQGSEEEMVHAIGTLTAHAFIVRRGNTHVYDMHSLVHLATRVWLQKRGLAISTMKKALGHFTTTALPVDAWENLPQIREYMPHLLSFLAWNKATDMDELYNLYHKVGEYLFWDKRLKDVIRYLEKTYEWRSARLPDDHPARLDIEHDLASAYEYDGRYKEAIQLLENIMAIKERKPETKDDRLHLSAQSSLATAYLGNTQTAQAVKLLEHVVEVQAKTLPENNPSRTHSQLELSVAYMQNGQNKEALAIIQPLLVIREKMYPETHPYVLSCKLELASAYLVNGLIKECIKLLEGLTSLEAKIFPETHPDRLAAEHELARAYLENGESQRAVKLFQHVADMEAKVYNETNPDRLTSHAQLAAALLEVGQVKESIAILENVVALRAKTQDETNQLRLSSTMTLGNAYLADGQVERGMELVEYVVRVRKQLMAETHYRMLSSQHELAKAYCNHGKVKEAIEILEHVVALREKTLDETHISRLESQHELARAYLVDGQVKRAVERLEKVVALRRETLDEGHPKRVNSEKLLAEALKETESTDS